VKIRLFLATLIASALALFSLAPALALAQVAGETGAVTLTVSPTSGLGSVTPKLTWSTTSTADGIAAASCQPSWQTASVATSGTQTLAAVTTSQSYTLTCTWDDTSAIVAWTAPTTNVDGSTIGSTQLPLTYTVNEGATGAETLLKSGVTALTYTATGLTAGDDCFTVIATDALGDSSAPSTEACKTVGNATAQATASLTIKAVPNPPGALTVK
jgi:hypothetical protein